MVNSIIDFNFDIKQFLSLIEGIESPAEKPGKSDYDATYRTESTRPQTVDAGIRELKDAGIDHAVTLGLDAETTWGGIIPSETVSRIRDDHPDFFLATGIGCDPHKGVPGLEQLVTDITRYDFELVYLNPWWSGITADHRKFYPVYSACSQHDVGVSIHSTMNLDQSAIMDYGHPKYLDQIAVDFPDLTIIARHPGYPWTEQLAAVAYRHDNVFIDMSSVHPAMWGPLKQRAETIISDRILFGTGAPFIPPTKALDWVESYLDWPSEVLEQYLHDNTVTLLKQLR